MSVSFVDKTPDSVAKHLILERETPIIYKARFNWKGATQSDGRYHFKNDLGYLFRIDALYLATSSVQLRKCEAVEVRASLLDWFGPSVVYADHVTQNDSSMVPVQQFENGLNTQTFLLGTGTAEVGRYCKVFSQSSQLRPFAPPMDDHTLVFAGAYAQESNGGKVDWIPIQASIIMSQGMTEELKVTSHSPHAAQEGGTTVVLTRYPVQAFNGLNPEVLVPVELAWEFIGNLLRSTTVHVYESRPR